MGELALVSDNLPSAEAELSEEEKEMLKRITGQKTNDGPENMLPRLSINYDAEYVDDTNEEAEPIVLKRGAYKMSVPVEEDGKTSYVVAFCKEPVFRPFIQTFRYSVYDAEKNGPVLMTTQFKNWGDAVMDDKGGEFRANQYKKKSVKLYADIADGIKCNRTLYGTVSMPEAKDMHGNAVEVADVPCMWITKGASFMPVTEALDAIDSEGKLMIYKNMKLGAKREKNGQVTYFTAVVNWLPEDLPLDGTVVALLNSFEQNIKIENQMVIDAYKKVKNAGKDDDLANNIIDVPDGELENDFIDDDVGF